MRRIACNDRPGSYVRSIGVIFSKGVSDFGQKVTSALPNPLRIATDTHDITHDLISYLV